MLWGGYLGTFEVRATGGETRLSASFPYNREATLAEGRAEVFAPRAFAGRINAGADIHLLFGHDYDRPLASRGAGSLTVTDSDDALRIEARVQGDTSWARDFLAAHASGLIRGLSPGFQVPAGGDSIERRGTGLLRTVRTADLFEVSVVTRPAYPSAQVEARNWQATPLAPQRTHPHPLHKWRV